MQFQVMVVIVARSSTTIPFSSQPHLWAPDFPGINVSEQGFEVDRRNTIAESDREESDSMGYDRNSRNGAMSDT